MPKRFVGPTIVLAALAFSPVTRAQTAPLAPQTDTPAKPANGQNENIHVDGWNRPQTPLEASGKKPGPAPVHEADGLARDLDDHRHGPASAAARCAGFHRDAHAGDVCLGAGF